MQLINVSIFDQQTKARTEAMAKTREERIKRREEHDKLKLNRYLQNTHSENQEVVIGDERFKLVAGGSKLVRVSGTCLFSYETIPGFLTRNRQQYRNDSEKGCHRRCSVHKKQERESLARSVYPNVTVSLFLVRQSTGNPWYPQY